MTAIYKIGDSVLPHKAEVGFIGAGVACGWIIGGPFGAMAGGAAAYHIKNMLQEMKDAADNYKSNIKNSLGTIYYRLKENASFVCTRGCNLIHYVVTCLPFWIIHNVANRDWVKATYVAADNAFLAKCRAEKCEGKSMDLASLFTPVTQGVSGQAHVISALAANATAANQQVSQKQIEQWVALGERLIQALTNGEASQVADGAIIVKNANGEEIYVESSVYSTRAIMWYFTAQALWGELAKNAVVLYGHSKPTAAEMQTMVKDFLSHATFVFPDKEGQIFAFLHNAKTSYTDNTALLSQDSDLQGADEAVRRQSSTMALHVIDDASKKLPGGARRTSINLLAPVDNGERRLAVRLEEYSNPTWLGQRREGHESTLWGAAQFLLGTSSKVVAALADFAPLEVMAPKTQQQSLQHAVHQDMYMMLGRLKVADGGGEINVESVYNKAKALPLHELLTYLIHPEHATVYDNTFAILHELSDTERDQLKVKIYRALLTGVQAGPNAQLQRRSNETLLMPHIVGEKALNYYWRTQVGLLKETLFSALFDTVEKTAKLETARDSYVNAIAKKIRRVPSAEEKIKQRKAHEEALLSDVFRDLLDHVLEKATEHQYAQRMAPVAEKPEL